MKVCTKCHTLKFMSQYNKNKNHLDGHDNYCRECRSKNYKEKKYYVPKGRNGNGIEKKPIVTKILNGVTFQFKHCTDCKTWKTVNNFHKSARMSDGLEIYCKACRKVSVGTYFKSEKGKRNSNKARNKRLSYGQQIIFSPLERFLILERDNWKCLNCGCKVHDRNSGNWNTDDKAHIDHIIALSQGGTSDPTNLRILCRKCNLSKKDKIGEKQISLF